MIKNLCIIFLIFSCSSSTFAQITLQTEIEDYLRLYQEKNFNNIDKYYFPEMWDYYDKGDVLEGLKSTFADKNDVKISITKPEILKISENYLIEGKSYHLVKYSNNLIFDFKNNESTSDMTKALESVYGSGNIYYNETKKTYTAITYKIIVARSNNGLDDWKFLVFYGSNEINSILLPQEIINKIL